MLRFIFWNLHRHASPETLARLAQRHEADIVIVAEAARPPVEYQLALNREASAYHYRSTTGGLRLFFRLPSAAIEVLDLPDADLPHWCMWRVRVPGGSEFLLVGVHLLSKRWTTELGQQQEARLLAESIRNAESLLGHRRTVVVGDFNMNPFETSMVAAAGLHAVSTREVALRAERVVQARSYPFFYNPMWSCFGDSSPGPPGTYHYASGDHLTYFWNVFDQVLIRPELIACLPAESVQVLTDDGVASLASPLGRPDAAACSDHFPIAFSLDV
ncbi:MAG: endonuclease/exonuclease/phosphatase family protein [Actinomycetota bacterium]